MDTDLPSLAYYTCTYLHPCLTSCVYIPAFLHSCNSPFLSLFPVFCFPLCNVKTWTRALHAEANGTSRGG